MAISCDIVMIMWRASGGSDEPEAGRGISHGDARGDRYRGRKAIACISARGEPAAVSARIEDGTEAVRSLQAAAAPYSGSDPLSSRGGAVVRRPGKARSNRHQHQERQCRDTAHRQHSGGGAELAAARGGGVST